MPEGADGSAYYRDGTCGTGGAGAFLRVSRGLPAGSTVCRTGAVPAYVYPAVFMPAVYGSGSSPGVRPAPSMALANVPAGLSHGAGRSAGRARATSSPAPAVLPALRDRHTAGSQ
jgi:hypothetical protein